MRRLGLALALLAGPALAEPVQGTVAFGAPAALPADAVLAVRLVDVARQGAPATVLAETRRLALGGPPYAFTLEVEPLLLGERRRLLHLVASIEVAGRERWRSDSPHPLTPASFDGAITLALVAVAADAGDGGLTLSCRGPGWTLQLEGQGATFATPEPLVQTWRGTVTRPSDDLVVWRGGPALEATAVALARAERCGDRNWSMTLVDGKGAVRQGCCADAP